MAKRAKPAAKRRVTSKSPKVTAGELLTLLDFVRYAVSRFTEARLVFAHGTTAAPLAGVYARWYQGHPRDKAPPMESVPVEVTRLPRALLHSSPEPS